MNVTHGLLAMRTLSEAGYAPLCPHLTSYVADMIPKPHAGWLQIDLPWVRVADVVFRIDGPSVGADCEGVMAEACTVPVYNDLEKLMTEIPPVQTDVLYDDGLRVVQQIRRANDLKESGV